MWLALAGFAPVRAHLRPGEGPRRRRRLLQLRPQALRRRRRRAGLPVRQRVLDGAVLPRSRSSSRSRGELDRYHAGEIGTAVAANAAAVVALYLGWRILRELEPAARPGPAAADAVRDAALLLRDRSSPRTSTPPTRCTLTAATLVPAARRRSEPRRRYLVAAGVCLGLMLATRYANVAFLAGVVVMFGLAPRVALALVGARR